MSRPKSNDIIVLGHQIAMQERAQVVAKFIATHRRKLTVEELTKVIYAAWSASVPSSAVKP